ncbi:probable leucine-rich repeat receptor-like serine/threonine-protein kinase At3g14840 isoform X1 [Papaver somniferum]|uniref:probable leucine-rich repeat receptor-like serine/threonine-protein kinase At3g14840 isoform X1 n=1 Tax=Papaver somniferum TaxID=3469 RepID=UPI000E702CAE|nr:probable leucine-rich repeat receptor-like serine/threonine-protein kinase At3g14840 isoform X1 [Papaver somniferum]XP_026458310.1 probable leucine-rich repeat receptor-like serine/threonine-protein kinase At3g14840 isoform X1 [Papaver somniferum]XP_026458312.1 probable leucine-rich repeat receptor-like serine/threonine-protein kinase At3g14840 isoform X1 [Papaver somniferum]XP_026458313.1 probable leucine-rich repeat receptor-like serine/threonine-protein kinase At3g14840 isoform X1 [Papaver
MMDAIGGSSSVHHGRMLYLYVFAVLLIIGCGFFDLALSHRLPDVEVEALTEIAKTLGKQGWDFAKLDPCNGTDGINCNCTSSGDAVCHVTAIVLDRQSLAGILPPELVKLPYLQVINLDRNYLNGSIPKVWGSMKLVNISLFGNRLSGPIPEEIGNITTLKNLALEINQLSGHLPQKLGDIVGINRIVLSSNNFTGEVPPTFYKLTNLTDFRISDNQFTGKIPSFIKNWTNLERLEIQASGLEGPIPCDISALENLSILKISDLRGNKYGPFPPLHNLKSMYILTLRSCNINGTLPTYFSSMKRLKSLDLSFNKLSGEIPNNFINPSLVKFLYLTGNLLTGPLPSWMLGEVKSIDLSYNNLTLENSWGCQLNRTINLFGSSSIRNSSNGIPKCLKSLVCDQPDRHSFNINCGGESFLVNGSDDGNYDWDQNAEGSSNFYHQRTNNWALSTTGDFMDNNDGSDILIAGIPITSLSMADSELYTAARKSPLSLTYYGFCLINGNYTVNLHFAEIEFLPNDKSQDSLGRRVFDVYIQGKLKLKDFNIVKAAGGVRQAVIKTFNVSVTSNSLEIRFYWAGKGTQRIPKAGFYGPLVSAISVLNPDFVPPRSNTRGKNIPVGAVAGIIAAVLCFVFILAGAVWGKVYLGRRNAIDKELRGLDLNTNSFTLRQIKAATNNFAAENKIGEGGFGPVYKGYLLDGTIIAVKQLSAKSKQGNREFINEIGMISGLRHPNLAKLYGCCVEGNQLLLIYEYLENNCLARALFEEEAVQLKLDWPTRQKICIGIARGLTYLHEESRLKIVHRDIKGTNVLLDKDLNPKISDFGLAKLDEEDDTHISTRIAGTRGYMAPEYALRGYLTDKADIYSFGVVALEIVSGKSNTSYRTKEECVYLLDWALVLQENGNLMELVDPKLESEFEEEEVLRMINIALMCTNTSPTLRPKMSSVVSMLESQTSIGEFVSNSISESTDDLKFEAVRDYHYDQTQSISKDTPFSESSTSAADLYPLINESDYWTNRD